MVHHLSMSDALKKNTKQTTATPRPAAFRSPQVRTHHRRENKQKYAQASDSGGADAGVMTKIKYGQILCFVICTLQPVISDRQFVHFSGYIRVLREHGDVWPPRALGALLAFTYLCRQPISPSGC